MTLLAHLDKKTALHEKTTKMEGEPTAKNVQKGARFKIPVSYTHLRAHETDSYLVCRLLLEKKYLPYLVKTVFGAHACLYSACFATR